MVKLEVLLFGGCVNSPHRPDGLRSASEQSLREIADSQRQESAPADGLRRLVRTPSRSTFSPRGKAKNLLRRWPAATSYWGSAARRLSTRLRASDGRKEPGAKW